MFHIISYVSNIFQTVYPRVVDSWMSHFDSQLQNCFVQGGQPEVPGLGDVLPHGGRQDLHHGAVPAVQDGALRTQQEGLVSLYDDLALLDVASSGGGLGCVDLDSRDELPRGDKFNVLVQDSEATLSERVLLLYDAAFLGLDFMEELAVGATQVRTHVTMDVVLDHHVQVTESSVGAGGLSGVSKTLLCQAEADICFAKHFELIRVHCYFCLDDTCSSCA